MPHDNDLRIADAMGDAAIASEIPEFNLDADTGEGAGPHHDYAHVIDVEATAVQPAKRKKAAIIAALALVAILLIASVAFLRHGNQSQQPPNPELAAIIQEAKTIPPMAGRKVDSLKAEHVKAPLSTPAPVMLPPQQSLAANTGVPLRAAAMPASPVASEPAKAESAGSAPTSPSVASAIPQNTATANPSAVSRADYDVLVSERDAITKERDKAQADVATLKAEKATASTKEIVKVPERETFTVKAVLADGVVLQNAEGKVVIAPTGARVTVDGKAMAVSR